MTAPTSSYEGKIIAGRYRVERLLGEGGMGSVWAGRHVTLGQLVAIKFIHPRLATSSDALRRFDLEAKAAARLKTRHAVQVYDHGVTADGEPYIVMEYLEGESLEAMLRRRGPLPLDEVKEIVEQAARALSAAHERGIVHRDLKPDNIFLSRDRDAGPRGYLVKLVDFGIAKMVEDEAARGAAATQAGTVLGTPHYMSPEALTASSPVTAASDIWSLGAAAFAAACGRVPFEGDAIGDVVLKVCAAPLPVPSRVRPELPRAFDEWFQKTCARAVEARFPSVAEAAAALGALEAWSGKERDLNAYEVKAGAAAAPLDSEEPQTSRRGLVIAGVLAGASMMLALLGYYVVQRTQKADREAAQVAASARALIEAENDRKLRAAEAAFWASKTDAGVAPDTGKRKNRRTSH